jgi:hypothetical protein
LICSCPRAVSSPFVTNSLNSHGFRRSPSICGKLLEISRYAPFSLKHMQQNERKTQYPLGQTNVWMQLTKIHTYVTTASRGFGVLSCRGCSPHLCKKSLRQPSSAICGGARRIGGRFGDGAWHCPADKDNRRGWPALSGGRKHPDAPSRFTGLVRAWGLCTVECMHCNLAISSLTVRTPPP